LAAFAIRLLAYAAIAYVAVVLILLVLQSRFIYPAPQMRAPLTPGYEEVSLETEDGLTLRAFYREAEEGLPTVLYFHGNGGTLAGASVSNGSLAAAGLGVLLVEYRGYGGNPGEPSEEGLYRDGEAALQWLNERGVAPSTLVIIGNSIGSGVATHLAHDLAGSGRRPAAIILIAPFTSLPDIASEALWWLPVRTLLSDRYENRRKLAELRDIPILIQHGSADTVVGDHHGRALAESRDDADFQPFDGSGHGLSFEQRSQDARRDWIFANVVGTGPRD
jgi:pimeloyl-ACP methyl ester carboxylesterase